MLENSEELKRYGSPGNRKVLFTETESNHYTRDHLKQVYETGQKTVQAIKHILSPRSQSFASPGPAGKGKETNASDSWDITKKVGRGIYNFIIGDEIATLTDGQLDWNDALAIASFTPAGKIVKIGKSVTYIKSTAESLGILASKAGSKLKSGFRSARDKVTTGLKQAGDQIRSGLKQTKDKITNGISEAKEKVKNAGSKLWGGIKGLFGKKKKKPDKNNNNAIQENRVGGPGYLQTFASKGTGNPAHNVAQYQKLKKQLALEEIQSVVKTTKHGAERLIERGFTPKDISELKLNPDIVKTQSDGAEVFIKQVNGKYNVIVEGDNGVITALKNISKKSLDRLEKNYDWR
ncbi:DUF4258 domain-containing protein [Melghiribacillus thermohalophilus]|nr:DUF4258 domain-containing protein [Melghiribacillus thermohalophilus]